MAQKPFTSSVPDFDDLPKVDGMPQGCAWGIFDRDGAKDVLGTLNFLMPDAVLNASSEIKEGHSISLNWALDGMNKFQIPGRKPAEHTLHYLRETMGEYGSDAWDDELSFNTQSSSQWDSLCHFPHQGTGVTYNGFKPTREALALGSKYAPSPTLEHWHQRGGLVGRGVLIDYKSYTEDKGIPFHAFDGSRITVKDIEACAAYQGVEFLPGDVLIVRTGSTELLDNANPEDLGAALADPKLSGLHGAEETARWLWNKRFAAVASDSSSFEAFPPLKPDGTPGSIADLVLHTYCLAMFGMPIGELWDLSRLAQHCKEKKRYSFFLTSVPLNHPALIASPPNAIAIF